MDSSNILDEYLNLHSSSGKHIPWQCLQCYCFSRPLLWILNVSRILPLLFSNPDCWGTTRIATGSRAWVQIVKQLHSVLCRVYGILKTCKFVLNWALPEVCKAQTTSIEMHSDGLYMKQSFVISCSDVQRTALKLEQRCGYQLLKRYVWRFARSLAVACLQRLKIASDPWIGFWMTDWARADAAFKSHDGTWYANQGFYWRSKISVF